MKKNALKLESIDEKMEPIFLSSLALSTTQSIDFFHLGKHLVEHQIKPRFKSQVKPLAKHQFKPRRKKRAAMNNKALKLKSLNNHIYKNIHTILWLSMEPINSSSLNYSLATDIRSSTYVSLDSSLKSSLGTSIWASLEEKRG
jgi:hypothetical protein